MHRTILHTVYCYPADILIWPMRRLGHETDQRYISFFLSTAES